MKFSAYQSIEITVPANTPAGQVIPAQQLFQGTFEPGFVTGVLVQEIDNPATLVYESGVDVGNGFTIVDFLLSDVIKPNMSVEPDKKFLTFAPQNCNTFVIFKIRTINTVASAARIRATFRIEDLSMEQVKRMQQKKATQPC